MKVTMRSSVAITLAALAFGAATASAHNTLEEVHEYHSTVVDTETVDCTDEPSRPAFTVETFFSTHVHPSVQVTLPSGYTLPTEAVGVLTSLFPPHRSTEGQQIVSTTSTSVEEQPTSSSAVASPSTEEEPTVSSTIPAFTSTNVESTFVTVPASSESVPAIVFTSSADAHSEASTEPALTTIVEQHSATETIVLPAVSTETPLINPLRPTVTPSDTPITTSITLTTTATLPGASTPPVKEDVFRVPSFASEAIQIPPVKQGVPPVVSNPVDSSILSITTKTLTHSNTAVITVIRKPADTSVVPDCFSTTYVTVYSPPFPPVPQATAPSAVPAIIQNTTVVATGVPRPVYNTTTTTNTTTVPNTPPIHGAAPTLSATPGILLAFCGLICYLI